MNYSVWDTLKSCGIYFYGLNDERLTPGDKLCKPTSKLPCFVEDEDKYEREEIICNSFGCNTRFSSISEFENHHKARHTNVCMTCKLVFPTYHLLDRHILESHDSFFQISAQKAPMYSCLLEFCPEIFQNPLERKQHCIKVHKFPSDFRFYLLWRKLKHSPEHTQISSPTLGKTFGKVQNSSSSKNENVVPNDLISSPTLNSRLGFDPDEMDCSSVGNVETSRSDKSVFSTKQAVRRVPNTISFGMGIPRGFVFQKGKRGKKHWHQKEKTNGTKTDLEKISFGDINNALEDMET